MEVLNLRKKSNQEPQPKASFKRVFNKEISAKKKDLPQQKPSSTISWEAPSFYYNPQKRNLSLIIIALSLSGGGIFFFRHDALTAIFLILSSLVLILYSNKRPEISKISIDSRGIAIGETAHYYKDLKSFWIHYEPGNTKELSLEFKKWYMPYVKVSIENKNPLIIRSLLINFVPEREHEHSLVDIISRKIGL